MSTFVSLRQDEWIDVYCDNVRILASHSIDEDVAFEYAARYELDKSVYLWVDEFIPMLSEYSFLDAYDESRGKKHSYYEFPYSFPQELWEKLLKQNSDEE